MQQNENVAEGLDNQSLSLDFLQCIIFVTKPLIFNKSTKDALSSSKFPCKNNPISYLF